MKVAGTATLLPAPPAVEAVLRDPRRLVEALPNVGELDWEADDDGALRATIRPATALGELPIQTIWRPREAGGDCFGYAVEGRTDEHFVRLDVALGLSDGAAGGTAVDWVVSFEATGTMRSAGQRTIEAIVGAQARIVLDGIAAAAASPERA